MPPFSSFFLTFRDKLKFFVISVFFINVFGGTIVNSLYLSQNTIFPENGSLDIAYEISSTRIKTTKNIGDIKDVNIIVLKIILKNNASYELTNLKLVMSNSAIGSLETPSALRFTYMKQKTADSVFVVPNLPAGKQKSSEILLYVQESGTYIFRVYVENDQKVKSSTSPITIVAE